MDRFAPLHQKTIDSPVGKLILYASDKGIRALLFAGGRDGHAGVRMEALVSEQHPLLLKAQKQLGEYFAGKRTSFDLPLDAQGTIFQQKAWRELSKIPYGETISYGEQATRMGDKNKARAAGMANGMNPIGIIVPCHRVIGASGSLTGFGGGLKAKDYLLTLEKSISSKAKAA